MNSIIPAEALAFFRRKKLKETNRWTDLWHGEHARYFTVARSVYANIIDDVYKGVDEALANGETLEMFKRKMTPLLQDKGWWGKTDDGVQLGSPRRLKTIYDTNMRMSYAAGRWERVQRRKDVMPYLRYVAVMDGRTREEHAKYHNLILPVDDPFWKTHYPPNGWGCRCIVQQLSVDDISRLGLNINKSPRIETQMWQNPSTGETKEIPVGIAPGFDYNVGQANLRTKSRMQVADSLKTIRPEIASNTINKIVDTQDFEDFYTAPHGYYAVGVIDNTVKNALKAKTSVCLLSDETLLKNKLNHPELDLIDYKQMNSVLGNYDILVQDTDKSLVAIKNVLDKKYWLAVKVTRRGDEIFTNTFHISNERQVQKLILKGKRLK